MDHQSFLIGYSGEFTDLKAKTLSCAYTKAAGKWSKVLYHVARSIIFFKYFNGLDIIFWESLNSLLRYIRDDTSAQGKSRG